MPRVGDDAKRPLSYRGAGVDIDRGSALIDRIKPAVAATARAGVIGDLGGFGGLFDLAPAGYTDPVLVSSTDGVGTKLKLAIDWDRHTAIGIDLVAMCVNDVLVQGAEPLFFLDYFATGELRVDTASAVIEGVARGCELAGAALLGGETAEMPDMYPPGCYDLAGFCVGAVERAKLIDGRTIVAGDAVLGLASSGLHSNGYSLVRRILDARGAAVSDMIGPRPLADELLEPTRIYVRPVLELLSNHEVHGLAHITGGGLVENPPRILPADVHIEIDLATWPMPPVFEWIMASGPVEETEMLRTFNCGIGMIIVLPPTEVDGVRTTLESSGERVFEIGRVEKDDGGGKVAFHQALRK
jgi:phosphoribosylformylglycinamidine cyclo-ligase